MKYFLIIIAFLLAACKTGGGQDGHAMVALADTDPAEWRRTVLAVPVDDTLARRDLHLFVRYDGSLRQRSLYLQVRTQAPDMSWVSDPVAVPIAAAGKEYAEVVVPWRMGVVFPRKGIYTVSITPRTGVPVRGLSAIGIME